RPAETMTDLDLTGAAEPGGADRDHLRLLVAAVLARAAHGAAQRREPVLEREAEILLALPPGVRAAVGSLLVLVGRADGRGAVGSAFGSCSTPSMTTGNVVSSRRWRARTT